MGFGEKVKTEYLVCSLEQGNKLMELGVKQDSIFYSYSKKLKQEHIWHSKTGVHDTLSLHPIVSRWTSGELGVMLPNEFLENKQEGLTGDEFVIELVSTHINKNEAIARADLLLYLLENKVISVEEVNKRLEVK